LEGKKKSFLIYFDSYPLLSALPMEQRGLLLSALMVYADRVWREPELSPEEVMDQFPMSQEARMACGFMAGNVARDTQRWLEQRRRRDQRRQEQPQTPSLKQQEDAFQLRHAATRRLLEETRET